MLWAGVELNPTILNYWRLLRTAFNSMIFASFLNEKPFSFSISTKSWFLMSFKFIIVFNSFVCFALVVLFNLRVDYSTFFTNVKLFCTTTLYLVCALWRKWRIFAKKDTLLPLWIKPPNKVYCFCATFTTITHYPIHILLLTSSGFCHLSKNFV